VQLAVTVTKPVVAGPGIVEYTVFVLTLPLMVEKAVVVL
jgi:hypothetical protein